MTQTRHVEEVAARMEFLQKSHKVTAKVVKAPKAQKVTASKADVKTK